MAYSGKYVVKNIHKYRGDYTKVTYRSSWEKYMMEWLDMSDMVVQWNSECVIIPYFSVADGKKRRYFMDFYAKFKLPDNSIKEFLFEVKPDKETREPKRPTRLTTAAKQRYLNELYTWKVNQSKWQATIAFCEKHKYTFKILHEENLKKFGFKGAVK